MGLWGRVIAEVGRHATVGGSAPQLGTLHWINGGHGAAVCTHCLLPDREHKLLLSLLPHRRDCELK